MKKIILISTLLALSTTPILAKKIHYFSGQKEYLQKCRICHGGSSVFVVTHSMKEWEEIMVNNGKDIALVHVNSNIFKRLETEKKFKPYFETQRYQKKVPYMNVFFKRFAKDSPNHPYKKK